MIKYLFSIILLFAITVIVSGLTADEKAGLESVRSSNSERRDQSRIMSAFIYLFIGLGMLFLACTDGVLMGWFWNPFTMCLKNKKDPIVWGTAIRCVICIIVLFVVSAAGGLGAWIIIGFFFFVILVLLTLSALIVYVRKPITIEMEISPQELDNVEDPASKTVTMNFPSKRWTKHPNRLGISQLIWSCGMFAATIACTIITVIPFFAWSVPNYKLWDHTTNQPKAETGPQFTTKAVQLMYSWESFAKNIRLELYAKITTSYCGLEFNKTLSDSQKESNIYDAWIKEYNVDMTIFSPSDYHGYYSVNDWFTRKLDASKNPRPIDFSAGNIVSPADSRVLIYPNFENAKVWVKGQTYSIQDLVGGDAILAKEFENGYVVINRLAPDDYHRFNTPIAGRVVYYKNIEGSLWSVSSSAAMSDNGVFYNARKIVVLQSTKTGSKVAVIAIGATCIGSIVIGAEQSTIGTQLTLGTELGYFQFGGSTVVTLFQAGKFQFNEDILARSQYPVESYMHVNQAMGNETYVL